MRTLIAALAAGAGLSLAASTAAHAETIACPLTQATRAIVDPLPSDWWTTPVTAPLSETRVAPVGGLTTLQCFYGSAGAIVRNAPAGEVCTATPTGFTCGPILYVPPLLPLPPAPVTRVSAALDWQPSYQIDLDTGTLATPGADLWYEAITATEAYITTINGAAIGAPKPMNGGLAGCTAEILHVASVPSLSIPVGSYVCVRTSDGRIAEFRLNALGPGLPPTWSIGFTTWE